MGIWPLASPRLDESPSQSTQIGQRPIDLFDPSVEERRHGLTRCVTNLADGHDLGDLAQTQSQGFGLADEGQRGDLGLGVAAIAGRSPRRWLDQVITLVDADGLGAQPGSSGHLADPQELLAPRGGCLDFVHGARFYPRQQVKRGRVRTTRSEGDEASGNATGSPSSERPWRALFSVPGFRRLFAARTLSQWGDTFTTVAVVVVVYQLTRSGAAVSLAVVVEVVPVLVFGLLGGALVDRLPHRLSLVGADLGRGAVALVLVAFPRLWVIYMGAFLLSTLGTLFNPAVNAVVPSIVGDRSLVGANSALWSAAVVSQIALAPAAGALLGAAGPRPAFAIDAASFLVSASLLAALPHTPPAEAGKGSQLSQIGEGLKVVRKSRLLWVLALVQALAALSAGASSALLVVLAERHLHLSPGRFGILLAAIGIGGGLGPLVLRRAVRDVRRRRFLFGPFLLRGGVDVVLAASSSFAVALGSLGAYGLATSTGSIAFATTLQSSVPERLRGRVFSVYDVVWQTARLVSIGVGGLLVGLVGIRALYVITGVVLIIAAIAGFVLLRPSDCTEHR